MKKFISSILVISMLAALTGCGGNNTSSDNSSSSGSTTSATESTPAESGNDSGAMTNEGGANSDANTGGESGGADSGTFEEDYTEYVPDPDGRAARYAEAALNAVEFPSMMEVTRSDYAESFFGLDLSLCRDFYTANAMISALLSEVIIVNPKEGCEDELKAQMDAHFDYIKNDPNAAFYPEQELSAEGAVSGVTEDGYYYIIVHKDGAAAAEALLAAE